MKFKLVCQKCGKEVEDSPIQHIKREHKLLEYFVFVPSVTWDDMIKEEPKPIPKPVKEKPKDEEWEDNEED